MRNKYDRKLSSAERQFVEAHEGVDLAAAMLAETDPEGPAHRDFDIHTSLRLRAFHRAQNSLHASRERRKRMNGFVSKIPVLRRFAKD